MLPEYVNHGVVTLREVTSADASFNLRHTNFQYAYRLTVHKFRIKVFFFQRLQ